MAPSSVVGSFCMSWIILDSRKLRMWRSLIWSVGIRIVCNSYLYVCVDYSTVNVVVTTYCSVVSGMALAVVLLACCNVLCSTSHWSVSSLFVYCYSGLVLGVVCSLEPSVGFVSDYSFEYGVWLDCQFVVYLVVHFCFPVYVIFLYCVHHLAFSCYV